MPYYTAFKKTQATNAIYVLISHVINRINYISWLFCSKYIFLWQEIFNSNMSGSDFSVYLYFYCFECSPNALFHKFESVRFLQIFFFLLCSPIMHLFHNYL